MSTMTDVPLDLQSPLLAPLPDYATPGAGGTSPRSDYLLPDLCDERPTYRRMWLAFALVIFALYASLVFRYWAAADSGVDQNAYLVGGRLLAEHGSMKYTLPNPFSYTGGMFVRTTPPTLDGKANPDGVYFPKYPFGLPLLYACFFWVFKAASVLPFLKYHVDPSQAAYWAFLVSPISAVLSVAGTFFLARQLAGSFAAALAAILLGSSQLMMMLANNPNSHESCMAFIVWGMFFCVRWLQTGTIWRGILGGMLVGYAATIRYNEGLLFIVMCVVVLSRLPWNQWKTWRSVTSLAALALAVTLIILQVQNSQAAVHNLDAKWEPSTVEMNVAAISLLSLYGLTSLVFCIIQLTNSDWMMYVRALVPGLGWAVPVGALLLVNHHTMGSFTGYDSTHESEFGAAFKWEFFWQNWEKVLRIINDLGLFFVVPFGVAGIFMLFRRGWRVGLMLVTWIVPGVMLYMSYYWSPDQGDAYARFFLTYLPALLVGAAVCFHDGLLGGRKSLDQFDSVSAKVAMSVGFFWLLPGTAFWVWHSWMTGRDSLPLQIGLIYAPAIVAVAAVAAHEIPLLWTEHRGELARFPLTIATGIVVATASGVSLYRSIHGLRNGAQETKIPLHDYRERLSLAQTGQMLLEKVPAKSLLFAESTGGISTPANYIQFLRDWELYSVDTFSLDGARRGGGPGGGARGRANGRGNNGNQGRAGRGNFGGGGFGGPGGGFGGPGGGGGGPANANANGTTDTTTDVARPTQPEQQEYHASLYTDKTARQLYQLEADVINKAFADGRRVFVAVAMDHSTASSNTDNGFNLFTNGGGGAIITNPMESFKLDLGTIARYQYKVVSRWQDFSLPEDKEDDFALTNNNPMGGGGMGGGGRGGNQLGRMMMGSDRVLDWQLVEITKK